jgi:hypothetical protein
MFCKLYVRNFDEIFEIVNKDFIFFHILRVTNLDTIYNISLNMHNTNDYRNWQNVLSIK